MSNFCHFLYVWKDCQITFTTLAMIYFSISKNEEIAKISWEQIAFQFLRNITNVFIFLRKCVFPISNSKFTIEQTLYYVIQFRYVKLLKFSQITKYIYFYLYSPRSWFEIVNVHKSK